jgi:uncharacterized repeat protein (TIGR03803 family)
MRRGNTLIALAAAFIAALAIPGNTTSAFAANSERVLYSFCSVVKDYNCADGTQSWAGLIFDSAGNLYGTTAAGGNLGCANIGAYGCGTVFKLTRSSDGKWTEDVLYRFCSVSNCTDGDTPYDGLIFDSAGNLYGTTSAGGSSQLCFTPNPPYPQGCGTVFELTPGADGQWTETVLYTFCSTGNCTDGQSPFGGLVSDSHGNLYGTTYAGGAFGYGTVFELARGDHGEWTYRVLHSFDRTNGATPEFGNLIFDRAGNLFGTTFYGGSCDIGYLGRGLVFKLTRRGDGEWTEKVLHEFCNTADGYGLYSGLVSDKAGNLYATTYSGGRFSLGTVFQLARGLHDEWTEKILHSFNGKDGCGPGGSLTFDAAGNLYGNANCGGANDRGTIFRLTPGAAGKWTEVWYSFKPGNDGYFPDADLIFDAAGHLYGTTFAGGEYDGGTVYEFIP